MTFIKEFLSLLIPEEQYILKNGYRILTCRLGYSMIIRNKKFIDAFSQILIYWFYNIIFGSSEDDNVIHGKSNRNYNDNIHFFFKLQKIDIKYWEVWTYFASVH